MGIAGLNCSQLAAKWHLMAAAVRMKCASIDYNAFLEKTRPCAAGAA